MLCKFAGQEWSKKLKIFHGNQKARIRRKQTNKRCTTVKKTTQFGNENVTDRKLLKREFLRT